MLFIFKYVKKFLNLGNGFHIWSSFSYLHIIYFSDNFSFHRQVWLICCFLFPVSTMVDVSECFHCLTSARSYYSSSCIFRTWSLPWNHKRRWICTWVILFAYVQLPVHFIKVFFSEPKSLGSFFLNFIQSEVWRKFKTSSTILCSRVLSKPKSSLEYLF